MQLRTYRDGSVWVRWLATPVARPMAGIAERATAAWNCVACSPNDPAWSDAPDGVGLPKVDLIYDCEICGGTTLQGRLEAMR